MQRAMRARSKAYSARSVFSRNPWRLRPAHCVYYNDGMNTHDLRRYAPATARNRDAILEVLQPELKPGDRVLEVGSGTGEHIVHFAQSLPQVHWQPSEADASQLPSIAAWIQHARLPNVAEPRHFDAALHAWPSEEFNAVLCINVVHYTPWQTVPALMAGAARALKPHGFLYTYGAYRREGQHTSPSNEAFDHWLRERDPRFGVRNLEDVAEIAREHGLELETIRAMPANNFSLIFRRS